MKILLTTLNAKFVHSSLALRYLKNYLKQRFSEIYLKEYTINDSLDVITADIYQEKADLVAFSCYIWNITQTLQIIQNIKKVAPKTIIVLGGPEVSYDSKEIMRNHPQIDYIIAGEGEGAFNKLLGSFYLAAEETAEIPGLTYRTCSGGLKSNPPEVIKNLEDIPSPYEETEDLAGLENKIIYYESSRGCPFNCQYCLSSTIQGVRFFPLDKVKKDLLKLIEIGVKQVKFVDRTFNCNKNHALELMKFLKEHGQGVNFHFEIAADLLDEDVIGFLATVSPGQFQFEIGIQSTNEQTIHDIQRKMDLNQVFQNITRLRKINNIHLHLDLIAGLPYEEIGSFRTSFDKVFNLKPHQLQLGFLKLLKGSGIRQKVEEYEYLYQSHPPYQVLANKWIDYNGIIKLQQIEELVEKYHNSGVFTNALDSILTSVWSSPFDFFDDFSIYWLNNDLFKNAHSMQGLYKILSDYYRYRNFPNPEVFLEVLKFDLLINNRVLNLPEWVIHSDPEELKAEVWNFIKNETNLKQLMPHFAGKKPKDIIKRIHYANFKVDLQVLFTSKFKQFTYKNNNVIFDYSVKDKVTGNYKFHII